MSSCFLTNHRSSQCILVLFSFAYFIHCWTVDIGQVNANVILIIIALIIILHFIVLLSIAFIITMTLPDFHFLVKYSREIEPNILLF